MVRWADNGMQLKVLRATTDVGAVKQSSHLLPCVIAYGALAGGLLPDPFAD